MTNKHLSTSKDSVASVNILTEANPNIDSFMNKYKDINFDFIISSPGRINIIGEHIDYCGYSVLPMTLEQCILLGVKKSNDENLFSVFVENENESFKSKKFTLEDIREFGKGESQKSLSWSDYVICGFKGIFELLSSTHDLNFSATLCIGTGLSKYKLPHSAGLSSSSALIVGSAIAATLLMELANICAKCEQYVGTEGGGMDQAACLFDFKPNFLITPVNFPSKISFVVAHCGVKMNKAATAEFNIRVFECRGITLETQKPIVKEIQKVLGFEDESDFLKNKVLQKSISSEPSVSLDDLNATLSENKKITIKSCLRYMPENIKDENIKEFHPWQRLSHVLSESIRVKNFFKIVNDKCSMEEIKELGTLMDESHESCSKMYECSSSDLDELVKVCKDAGAYGSRMTGAGWGGCVVSMIDATASDAFIAYVQEHYYEKRGLSGACDDMIFVSMPGLGASVYQPIPAVP